MIEFLLIMALLVFWIWVVVKVSGFVWRSTDPRAISEMRTRSTMARMEREREAQRRLEGE